MGASLWAHAWCFARTPGGWGRCRRRPWCPACPTWPSWPPPGSRWSSALPRSGNRPRMRWQWGNLRWMIFTTIRMNCDYCVSPSPLGLDFGTLDFGLGLDKNILIKPCLLNLKKSWLALESRNPTWHWISWDGWQPGWPECISQCCPE